MIPFPWTFWAGTGAALLLAVLSAAGIALSELSWGAVHKLEALDSGLAERIERYLGAREDLLATVHALQTLTALFLFFCGAAWGEAAQTARCPLWAWASVPVGVGVVYFALAEYLGRDLSVQAAARFLRMVIPPVRIIAWTLFPVAAGGLLRRYLRKRTRTAAEDLETTAEDEIRSLVEQDAQQEEEGEKPDLEDDERRMIRGIFDLDETLVREIMTPRVDVDAVEESASFDAVRATIVESGHSRIPTYRDSIDHIVGLIHAKDLLDDAKLRDAPTLAALQHQPIFIPETKNIGDLLAEFQQSGHQFAVVLDEYGGTAGIVTVEDILEEIVGEIRDEYDVNESEPEPQRLPDGCILADGRTPVHDLEQEFGLTFPDDEDYDTLGGYIAAVIGRIPTSGETVETPVLSAEILDADIRRVKKVRITPTDSVSPRDDD
ncbi:MAG: HlyC/CorC family transporter [Kiritimatiellaeota bacterium]|nr:HlyC/CorC family transporter [Kiritimatiellota bacterium]